MDMREPAAPRYRWDLPPTRQTFGNDPVQGRGRFGGLLSSPRLAAASVALLAAASVAGVAMLVFNPFADPFDDAVADAAPQTVTATVAALPVRTAEAGTSRNDTTAATSVPKETTAAAPDATQRTVRSSGAPKPASNTAAAETARHTDPVAPIAALAEKVEPLAADDPRWGAAATSGNPLVARKPQSTDDTSRTAFAGDLPSAQGSETRATVDDTDEDQGDIGEAAKPAAGMVKARIRTSVNMRSRGADGAPVLGVIPGGTEVSMADGCRHWCKIVYDGRTGYVYKSFIRR